MKHLKRQKMPKNWPIARKGTTYVVKPISGEIPILIILRDILKIAKNRKEVKKAINNKHILLNTKIVNDEKKGLSLLDTISIIPMKKFYQLNLSQHGKFKLEEIKEEETHQKISKVINKKVLKGKKVQINLSDGYNIISETKCDTNDSVIIDLSKKKIIKCLPLQIKASVIVFAGKHAGKKGLIKDVKKDKKMVIIETEKGTEINVLIKQIIVIK